MFSLPILLIMIGIFTAIQIGVWSMLPVGLKDIIFSNPILAFIVNLAGSNLILMFTGIASFVGICNLGASVIFGIYATIYKKQKGISGLTLEWKKILGFIPLIPALKVQYNK